jgi:nucleotide-binding universal stress UspA family protein
VYSKILVPLDGSEVAATILEQVALLARTCGAQLLLLTVGYTLPASPAHASEVQLTRTFQAEAYLAQVRKFLEAQGVEVTTAVCLGEPAPEILAFAARQQVDLIVINSRGGGGTPWPFLGSVAATVAAASVVPVLIYGAMASQRHAS